MNESIDLGAAFDKLIDDSFFYYRGFKAEKITNGGLSWKGKYYASITKFQKAVDDYIREGGGIIQNSINRTNPI